MTEQLKPTNLIALNTTDARLLPYDLATVEAMAWNVQQLLRSLGDKAYDGDLATICGYLEIASGKILPETEHEYGLLAFNKNGSRPLPYTLDDVEKMAERAIALSEQIGHGIELSRPAQATLAALETFAIKVLGSEEKAGQE